MSKIESSAGKALYEQQETKLSQQSAAFIELLTKRGILGDSSIDDDRVRQAKKEKKKSMYHNTLLLLQHYRTILWTLECFPSSVAEELDRPLKDLDTLLDRIDLELGMNNRKLEGRMESVRRSHLLVDRLILCNKYPCLAVCIDGEYCRLLLLFEELICCICRFDNLEWYLDDEC